MSIWRSCFANLELGVDVTERGVEKGEVDQFHLGKLVRRLKRESWWMESEYGDPHACDNDGVDLNNAELHRDALFVDARDSQIVL